MALNDIDADLAKYVGLLECTPETFDGVVNVNLRDSLFLAQAAADKMIEVNQPGCYIDGTHRTRRSELGRKLGNCDDHGTGGVR